MGIVEYAVDGSQDYAKGAVAENEMLGDAGNTIDSTLQRLQEIQGGNADETGNQSEKTTIKVGTTDLSKITGYDNLEGLKDYYGETTDFKSATEEDNETLHAIKWQLFYDDATNIYLIASDYIPSSLFPSEIIRSDYNSNYAGSFTSSDMVENEQGDYVYDGPIMLNSHWANGAEANVFTNNTIASNYLKWIAYAKNNSYTLNYPSMRAVAFMMDTSKWSSFAGGIVEASAIGGPTVEMFALSYNAGHPSEPNLLSYSSIITEGDDPNANEYGYYVNSGDYVTWQSIDLDEGENNQGNMWCITSRRKADCFWLASPWGAINGDYSPEGDWVCYAGSSLHGDVVYNNNTGFRPIVIIPKSILK